MKFSKNALTQSLPWLLSLCCMLAVWLVVRQMVASAPHNLFIDPTALSAAQYQRLTTRFAQAQQDYKESATNNGTDDSAASTTHNADTHLSGDMVVAQTKVSASDSIPLIDGDTQAKPITLAPINFFTTDIGQVSSLATSEDWIAHVGVKRDWQRGIVVSVLPRVPVAKFGSEHLIDAQGHVYRPVQDSDLHKPDLVTLQGDTDQSLLIMRQYQLTNQWFAPVHLRVSDIILTPRMTWLLQFDNGMRVIVDHSDTAQKLMALSQLLAGRLRADMNRIEAVDLRYHNGFSIRWKPDVDMQTVASSADGK